jgi:hypothetical protein
MSQNLPFVQQVEKNRRQFRFYRFVECFVSSAEYSVIFFSQLFAVIISVRYGGLVMLSGLS